MSTKAQVDTERESGSSKRRRWSKALKRLIVVETLEPGSSVSIVARRHDVNINQAFTSRRELLAKKPLRFLTAQWCPSRSREEMLRRVLDLLQ